MTILETFGVNDMAVWTDLLTRLEDGINADKRLHAETIYRGNGIPAWLRDPFEDTIENAGERSPAMVINVKGSQAGDSLVIMRLRDFEAMTENGTQ